MFCLRSWLPTLVFVSGASPIYIIVFLTGYYIWQRPCAYCTLLLLILVASIFDFSADLFEPRWNSNLSALKATVTSFLGGHTTLSGVVVETASMAVSALNGTGGSLASIAMEHIRQRLSGEPSSAVITTTPNGLSLFEWLRNILDKRQMRIPCLDVIVRI